jgi:Peptidase family M28
MNVAARMELIRELCSFEGRLAGTDAERRVANRLAERLGEGGRRVEVEPTYVHPQAPLIHAAHCALGVAGSLVAVASPPVGFAIVLATAVSVFFDFNTRFYLLRRLFFRRASQNVFSPGGRPDAPARLILNAHYDAGRSGYLFSDRMRRRQARVPAGLRLALAPPRLMFWSLALLLPSLGARMAGVDSNAIALAQLPFTLVLLVGAFALVDIQLSDIVPGANDDATGVATAISLARALDAEPPEHLEVCVLLTGGEECGMEGMRSFMRTHRAELDRSTTYFVTLEMLGLGELRYQTAEGLAITYTHDRRLAELCDAVATGGAEEGLDAAQATLPTGTDALPATLAGYPAIVLTGLAEDGLLAPGYHTPKDTPESLDPEALDRAHSFALGLVRALDRDVKRRQAPPAR